MEDSNHSNLLLPPTYSSILRDERDEPSQRQRGSVEFIAPNEQQNVYSRNVSFGSASAGSSGKENGNSSPRHLQFKIDQPSPSRQGQTHERTGSFISGLKSGPRDPNTLASAQYPRSVSAMPQLGVNQDTSRSFSPARERPYSTMSPVSRLAHSRPKSYIDLLNLPYPQQAPAPLGLSNADLSDSIGRGANLLTRQKTLEMYRANVKKTTDVEAQYSFALLLIETAQELARTRAKETGTTSAELLLEARQLLQKLADKSYPFAQYYLADGYASGFFNAKGRPDDDKAFPLFLAASKHGHAEAGYRAGLCYEYGWGTRIDPTKASQFYRQSASKNHPGAMTRLSRACLSGDLGGAIQYREGIKWLKRASESADKQYNSAPYDLACLHETGYGDDIFIDRPYAAQLFTQAADLDNADAAFRLGQAYEHGQLDCPVDASLSIHFYSIAAGQGHAQAMFALCAWYIVGAEPVLERDEAEAYEWAKKAAELGLAKAQYALAYFSEVGIGGRRDPLEANAWYVRAAEQGDEKAIKRIRAIRNAAAGGSGGRKKIPVSSEAKTVKGKKSTGILKGSGNVSEEQIASNANANGNGNGGKGKWRLFRNAS